MKKDRYYWAFISIFLIALLLRLLLALFNRQANDDHMLVVQLMMSTGRLPVVFDCHECFQPKLFYAAAEVFFRVFHINTLGPQILFMQLFNVMIGIITLDLLWRFIREYPGGNEKLKLLVFALIALNPKFVAINAQASNDSLVILFCSLAVYFSIRFYKNLDWKFFALVVLFSLLAVSTKANGWIVVIAIFLSFLVIAWARRSKQKLIYAPLFLVMVFTVSVVNPLTQFVTNYREFGSFITKNEESLPLPPLFPQPETYQGDQFRPGILSIQDGFFSFKLIDLLKDPIITNGQNDYPPQRTSFWTMLYADSNSLHFQFWPPDWQTRDETIFNIGRGIFVLALFPALIFIAGFLLEMFIFWKNLMGRNQPETSALIFLTGAGYLAFLLLAALLYRDYSFVKMIYILPGLLAFTWLFLRGAEKLVKHWPSYAALILLLGFYLADIVSMIHQLFTLAVH
jgi:Dolichyl-phosphate-mannose-protein mannosyltransferase